MTIRVHLLSDPGGARWARVIDCYLRSFGHEVTRVDVPRYPQGGSLPLLLGRLSASADVGIVFLGADSANADWIAPELRSSHLYPRLLLALSPGLRVPRGWRATDPRLLLAGDDPALRVMWAMDPSTTPLRGEALTICDHCFEVLPSVAGVSELVVARIRALCWRNPAQAQKELRAACACSHEEADLWVNHGGEPQIVQPGPPCPGCDAPLATTRLRCCDRCGADWRALTP